jgi:T4 superinfection immunity protein
MAEDPSPTGVIAVIVLFSCYFMPAIIALLCDKRGACGVALVNFFLGWTVIGWFVAFIWSCTGKTRADDRLQAKRHHEVMLGKR